MDGDESILSSCVAHILANVDIEVSDYKCIYKGKLYLLRSISNTCD